MPNIPGAEARQQSRTLQSLDRFTPDAATALAAVALVLLDRINSGEIAINDRALLGALYDVQDALRGASGKLPAALALFLATVEGVNHG